MTQTGEVLFRRDSNLFPDVYAAPTRKIFQIKPWLQMTLRGRRIAGFVVLPPRKTSLSSRPNEVM